MFHEFSVVSPVGRNSVRKPECVVQGDIECGRTDQRRKMRHSDLVLFIEFRMEPGQIPGQEFITGSHGVRCRSRPVFSEETAEIAHDLFPESKGQIRRPRPADGKRSFAAPDCTVSLKLDMRNLDRMNGFRPEFQRQTHGHWNKIQFHGSPFEEIGFSGLRGFVNAADQLNRAPSLMTVQERFTPAQNGIRKV